MKVDSRAARRLVLYSGYTLVRQSAEFVLHFTNFSVKVTLRSTEAVWTSSHGFLREGEPRILFWYCGSGCSQASVSGRQLAFRCNSVASNHRVLSSSMLQTRKGVGW